MRRTLTILAVAVLTALPLVAPTASAAPPDRADVIVVLHDGVDPTAVARDHGADVAFVYQHALNGFAGAVPAGRLNGLERDPRVRTVAPDQLRTIAQQTVPTGISRIGATANIDGGSDSVKVDVAVLDTGIDIDHPDLNVVGGIDCTYSPDKGPAWARTYACLEGSTGDDDHYHGTHVAGTIGALDNGEGVVGVAPGARLWAVKVLDHRGSGYDSGIIAGIEWVTERKAVIEVANMSLGGSGGTDDPLTIAVNGAVAAGVTFVVAAGNDSRDVSGFTPANAEAAITVSALADSDGLTGGGAWGASCWTDEEDTFANFSNYGSGVDIIAPGVCILSTFPLEDGGYGTISGTSMASPHAAGAAALVKAANPTWGPAAVRDHLVLTGTDAWDASDDGDDIKEPLLNVGAVGDSGAGGGSGGSGGGEEPPPTGDLTAGVDYERFGGRNGKHLAITVTVNDTGGTAAAGVSVDIVLSHESGSSWPGSGTTGSDGTVRFELKNAPTGCYETDVTSIDGQNYTDPAEPFPSQECSTT